MEGLPLRLLLNIFLMAVILSSAFYALGVFMQFADAKSVSDSVSEIRSSI